jgi:hypothetical protein
MDRKIVGFHLDEESHWVADLDCGHKQHVRHDPPMVERPWVLTPEGRQTRIGAVLKCKRCDEFAQEVARCLLEACAGAVRDGYLEGGFAGLCKEGQLDLIVDRIKNLDVLALLPKPPSDL